MDRVYIRAVDGLGGTNKTGADLNGLPRLNAPVIVYFREIRRHQARNTWVSWICSSQEFPMCRIQSLLAGDIRLLQPLTQDTGNILVVGLQAGFHDNKALVNIIHARLQGSNPLG